MRLYPAIDIKNGNCVRLLQGQFDKETIYSDSPATIAKKWEAAGATFIHVVDLDGALDGNWTNQQAISDIVKAVNIPVQTGGGIRTFEDIEVRLKSGINRVIIGTMAIKQPKLVKKAVEQFGSDRIVVGIDAKDGMVAVHGWEEVSEVSALDLCLQMKEYGVNTIVYTDIAKDGMMTGPNIEQTRFLIEKTGMDIIASGGVSNMKDLENIEAIQAEGAIIGKALYIKAIELSEAVQRFEKG